jgi:hypothetical protein
MEPKKSNFLDDQLYDYVMKQDYKILNDKDSFFELLNQCYKICEDKWKPQFYVGMPKKQLKVNLDRVFNSWDLFVKRLVKAKFHFAEVFVCGSYKIVFMSNPELKRIYDEL